jgi:uncharacterized protein YndB with AHSA1/START domain
MDAITTVTFEEIQGNKTKLTIRMRFDRPEVRDRYVKAGMSDGWAQSMEKLVALVT